MKYIFKPSRVHRVNFIIYISTVSFTAALVVFFRPLLLELDPERHASVALYLVQLSVFLATTVALLGWFSIKQSRKISTEYEENLRRLQMAEKQINELEMALNAHAIVAITDSRGVITQVNDKFCTISQYSREELIGQTHQVINSGYHPKEFFKDLWHTIIRSEVWSGDVCNRAKDGSLYWVQSTIVPLIGKNGKNGKPEQYIAIRADITSRKEAEAKNQYMALHDALTGLPNRRLMTDRLISAISSKGQHPGYGAVLLMDLDHFKEINDMLGHGIGDDLLLQTTLRLSCNVRKTDTVARFGGDEFVIILDNVGSDIDSAITNTANMGEVIRTAVAEPYQLGSQQLTVTSSMGVVLFCRVDDEPEELIKQADIALYAAKEAGRNQLFFFDPLLQTETIERALLVRDLRQALEQDELVLFYQPIVDAQQHIRAVEALLRWFHPKHGVVLPSKFIPLAEKNGLIVPIGTWVLETACAQLAEWQQYPAREALIITVNVSARQLSETNFVDTVKSVLAQTGARADRLILEITESIFQDNVNSTITKMNALRQEGVRFSLDDFGTGYSSLTYLKRLPIDHLKIDKSFVDDIFEDSCDIAIVHTIIALAKNLQIDIIAEGVETCEQVEWLQGNGCKFFQGYLFSHPLHPDKLNAILKNTTLLPAKEPHSPYD
ncbi:MAG: EAL domain-containing protein [Oceanisphaera sp.]|uniref:putative bifunctional diguanylate cyclase/phosphodiesterase n=1 Tax=Oceanisphaera sp. TaxID=1929979 RepID=UPI003C784CF5